MLKTTSTDKVGVIEHFLYFVFKIYVTFLGQFPVSTNQIYHNRMSGKIDHIILISKCLQILVFEGIDKMVSQ